MPEALVCAVLASAGDSGAAHEGDMSMMHGGSNNIATSMIIAATIATLVATWLARRGFILYT